MALYKDLNKLIYKVKIIACAPHCAYSHYPHCINNTFVL